MSAQTDALNDDLDDDETPQGQPSQQSPRQLREAAKAAEKTRAENEDLRRELAVYKAGLGGLSEKQLKAVMGAHDGDMTPDLLKATAVELGFLEAADDTEEQQQIAEEIREQGRISQAATGGGRGSATTQLTPEVVNGWPIDKQMRLNTEHPDIYDRLLRGETVSGVSFV